MRRGRSSKLVAVFLALILGPHPAYAQADNTSKNSDTQQIACGPPASGALDEARKRLASRDAESQRIALACLIEAVGALQSSARVVTRADGDTVLAVPQGNRPVP